MGGVANEVQKRAKYIGDNAKTKYKLIKIHKWVQCL